MSASSSNQPAECISDDRARDDNAAEATTSAAERRLVVASAPPRGSCASLCAATIGLLFAVDSVSQSGRKHSVKSQSLDQEAPALYSC